MTTRNDIDGLTQFGSTAQTIALADVLYRDPTARTAIRDMLNDLEEPIRYSNEDGDLRRYGSTVLANLIRRYDGPKIY